MYVTQPRRCVQRARPSNASAAISAVTTGSTTSGRLSPLLTVETRSRTGEHTVEFVRCEARPPISRARRAVISARCMSGATRRAMSSSRPATSLSATVIRPSSAGAQTPARTKCSAVFLAMPRRTRGIEMHEREHGSYSTYTNHSCRCAPCRDANSLYQAAWRKEQRRLRDLGRAVEKTVQRSGSRG